RAGIATPIHREQDHDDEGRREQFYEGVSAGAIGSKGVAWRTGQMGSSCFALHNLILLQNLDSGIANLNVTAAPAEFLKTDVTTPGPFFKRRGSAAIMAFGWSFLFVEVYLQNGLAIEHDFDRCPGAGDLIFIPFHWFVSLN